MAAEFDRDEDLLVDHARTLSHSDLVVAVRHWSDRVDQAGAEDRAAWKATPSGNEDRDVDAR